MKRLHLISLGCPKTRVDSEVMYGLLKEKGWSLTENPEDADAILVATCAFLQSSIEESIDSILESADYKRGKCRRLVVSGCLPSRFKDQMQELKASLPEVDAFLTTNELPAILDAVEPRVYPKPEGDFYLSRALGQKSSYAYLKISEGCNRRCSFCTIPLIRGKQVSRPIESLVREARQLAQAGVRELVLVAQELTGYGSDLGMTDGLLRLLDALEPIDGIEWIRLMYTYPWNFSDSLIGRLGHGKVLPYVDIPLQHVSQRILDDMRRHVTQQQQDALLRKLRAVPGSVLRTSLIVGYPGETQAEVDELEQWIREIRFDRLGVFEYSAEDGTPAGAREDQIASEVKAARYDQIMSAQQEIHAQKMANLVGQTLEVLVDGVSPEHELVLEGRYYGQAPEIDGKVYLSFEHTDREGAQAGEFVKVNVVDASAYDIVGEVV